MQEESLYTQWQMLARTGRALQAAGHTLRVIRAGRLNTQQGPDFVAARFELDGVIYQGDVECHLQAQDWYRHGHHLDNAYRGVLLHVVAAGASPEAVGHELSAQAIPSIPLPEPPAASSAVCPFGFLPQDRGAALLQELALQRLRRKVHRFSAQLARSRPEVVFQEAFLRVMGYPRNAQPFSQLAGRVFFSPDAAASLTYLQLYALYAGQAGFLSSASDDFTKRLTAFYHTHQSLLPQAALQPQVWQLAALRPANHPHFRLAGALLFFKRHAWRPLEDILALLSRRQPFAAVQQALTQLLSPECDAYWQTHYALGRPLKQARQRLFFGAARRSEIILNVFLPLTCAIALEQGSNGFQAYLEDFYFHLPAVIYYGGLRRRFRWLEQARRLWPAQALNLSLLELQEQFCLGPEGAVCPLFGISCPVIDSQSKNHYTLPVPNED